MKQIILESAEEHVGKMEQKRNKKPWITSDIIDKMAERLMWENDKSENGKWQYMKINNELRRITDQAKEKWINSKYREIEELIHRGHSEAAYKIVKELSTNKKKFKRVY